MDELAFEVSKVLYPMDISTSSQGKLQKVLNHIEILDRWNKKKEKIKEFFKGDIVDKYINQTEKIIKNEEALFSKIQKDWFLNIYFDSLYKFYSEDLFIDESKYYYVANTSPSPIKYKAKSKIEINEKDIRIKTKGIIHDERCARDIEHGFDSPYYKKHNKKEKALKGSCNLVYLLEKDTAIIEGIEAEFETKFKQPKKVLIKMFLLEKLTTKRNSMLVEKEEKTSQTGFWGKLFKK
ncbi:hypothetical protein [Aquimarina sp. MMG016]|uniref:hypothetical protein n=1 Tax=Aquimarina sp. MMG016 TaxID=2822690 RepID=UPI001B39FED0|nr:hypothetical protein [Aquimarina sp. MMG016]MBQ4821277.1 hypothetical protein [Aquimarina sp. MMG016]